MKQLQVRVKELCIDGATMCHDNGDIIVIFYYFIRKWNMQGFNLIAQL